MVFGAAVTVSILTTSPFETVMVGVVVTLERIVDVPVTVVGGAVKLVVILFGARASAKDGNERGPGDLRDRLGGGVGEGHHRLIRRALVERQSLPSFLEEKLLDFRHNSPSLQNSSLEFSRPRSCCRRGLSISSLQGRIIQDRRRNFSDWVRDAVPHRRLALRGGRDEFGRHNAGDLLHFGHGEYGSRHDSYPGQGVLCYRRCERGARGLALVSVPSSVPDPPISRGQTFWGPNVPSWLTLWQFLSPLE